MAEREGNRNSLLIDRIPVVVCHQREKRAKRARVHTKVCTVGIWNVLMVPCGSCPVFRQRAGKWSGGFSLFLYFLRAFTLNSIVSVIVVCSASLIVV